LARDQVQRLVPRPGIGVAPPGGVTLVNIQTIFWVDTSAQRWLGSVLLVGRHVDLQASLDSVAWDFGDGHDDVSTGPGTPYSTARPCGTPQCPGYYGHTYRTTGAMTVRATVTWSGRYRVDGGAWQAIAGTVRGAPATLQLTVKQSRGVLVGDPGP
jgi:hypothetical protein